MLLYLTPLHCQDMLDSVVVSLNAVHAKFMRRNPDFRVRKECLSLFSRLRLHEDEPA